MNITCPQCGFSRDLPEDKAPAGNVVARCPKCGCRFRFSASGGAGAIIPAGEPAGNGSQPEEEDIRVVASHAYEAEARRHENEQRAREARERLALEKQAAFNPWEAAPEPDGWLAAFYQTIIRVMFQPHVFFAHMRPHAAMPRPLAFFLAISVFQTLMERVWGQVIHSWLSDPGRNDPQLEALLSLLTPDTNIALLLALRCGALIFQLYMFSLLMYLAYRVVARDKATFSLVFQVVAYSAAPWTLCVVPGVGSLAGTIWGVGCLAVGCKAALELDWPRTLVGFLPIIAVMAPLLPRLFGMFS